jgi:hypothetical protein
MTSVYPVIDWLTCDCSIVHPEDEEEEGPACGNWGCAGDCYICSACQQMLENLFLPIYGPVTKDGASMGFLLVSSKIEG